MRTCSPRSSESQFGAKEIEIRLSHAVAMGGQDRTLSLPWTSPSPYQRREIIQGEGEPRSPIRPMRVRARAVFAESSRNAHRGLDGLKRDLVRLKHILRW